MKNTWLGMPFVVSSAMELNSGATYHMQSLEDCIRELIACADPTNPVGVVESVNEDGTAIVKLDMEELLRNYHNRPTPDVVIDPEGER